MSESLRSILTVLPIFLWVCVFLIGCLFVGSSDRESGAMLMILAAMGVCTCNKNLNPPANFTHPRSGT